MSRQRFRTMVRSALAIAVSVPAGIVAACSTESAYPFYAPDGAATDAASAFDASDSSARDDDGGRNDAAPSCADDFDAAPVTCSQAEELTPEGTCPPRPGVCGSDGRTYCSAESAVKGGASVVVGTACDQPCGRLLDGGPNVCNAATEYCYSITQVLATTWSCKPFSTGCDAGHSCSCVAESKGCTVRDGGAVYVHEQGAVTIRAPGQPF